MKIWKGSAFLCFFILIVGCTSSVDFIANRFFLPNEGIRKATYDVRTERKAGLTLSDGTRLFADIFHPEGLKKTPTILVRIPFTKTFYNTLRSDVIGRYWAARGYTVITQGTRGRYESEGKFYPLIYERKDGIETLQWLKKQSWFNGKLVMWGGSSFGHTQWAISDQSDPKINGYFIQIVSTNFRGMFYPGNAFSLESAVYWAIRSKGRKDRPVKIEDLKRGVQTLPILRADDVAIGDTDFYNDWITNKENDEYWLKIDGKNRAKNIKAPMLMMAGWFDPFLPGQLKDFRAIKENAPEEVAEETRLIIGPWRHAANAKLPNVGEKSPYRASSIAPSIPWFDHVLGIEQKPLDMPKVKIFVMGINKWRAEKEWPLARTRYTPFYLRSSGNANSSRGDGLLSQTPAESEEASDRFSYNPANPVPTAGGAMLGYRSGIRLQNKIEERKDVLVYDSGPLEKPVEITGPIRVILYVDTDAPSTDFTVKLTDVFPEGKVYNLSDGILRRNYQAKDVPVEIEIELWPTSNVFLKGHRIRLEISSSNFPRYDRNPNTGESASTATRTAIANQVIYHSQKYPSRIILPVIPPKN